jgi:catechol 2,3-dioxygenase-like lactoylglutathione lyase family enzyme
MLFFVSYFYFTNPTFMKKIILLTQLCLYCVIANGQANTPATKFEYQPYFSAVIVSNVDTSVKWYEAVFGLVVKNTMSDPGSGYKVVTLESSNFFVELLQLDGSLAQKPILEGKPEGTKVQGLFKVGFKVPDMDSCLKRLAALKIDVPHIWTDNVTKKRNFLITDPDGNLVQFYE